MCHCCNINYNSIGGRKQFTNLICHGTVEILRLNEDFTDKEGVFLSRPEKRQQHQMAAERPETIVRSGG